MAECQAGINNFGLWIAGVKRKRSDFSTIPIWYIGTSIVTIWLTSHVDDPNQLYRSWVVPMRYYLVAQAGTQVFGQDPLWFGVGD